MDSIHKGNFVLKTLELVVDCLLRSISEPGATDIRSL